MDQGGVERFAPGDSGERYCLTFYLVSRSCSQPCLQGGENRVIRGENILEK
jgi:hypothetical protein